MIYSFDVFDTLLTRVYATPEDVHLHLGEILVQCGLARDVGEFVRARREAEYLAWKVKGGAARAIDIDSIYQLVADKMGWGLNERHQAMVEEVRLESDGVRPVAETARRLDQARSSGNDICFISDMHLRSADIRTMLARLEVLKDAERIFVSSDLGVTKRHSGKLYLHALRSLNATRWQLRHFGDDRRADLTMARRRLIRSRLLTRAKLNRFELHTLAKLPANDWRARSLATVSKFARLSDSIQECNVQLWELLSSTIAPFVCAYAIWIIEQAQKRGIETLYFLARDMQIVYEVTRFLTQMKALEIRCVYVYASRTSWQGTTFRGDDFDLFCLSDQLRSDDPLSALQRILDEKSISDLRSSRPNLVDRPIHELLADPAVITMLSINAARRRSSLIAYLSSLGYSPTSKCALVDAGWRGTLQKCLARAYLEDGIEPKVNTLYIGIRHAVRKESGCEMISFLPRDTVDRFGYSLVSVAEAFLTANHGTTLTYNASQGGAVEPVLASCPSSDMIMQWQVVRRSCVAYAGELVRSPGWDNNLPNVSHCLAESLLLLCSNPTNEDARALRGWRYDVGREQAQLKQLNSRLSVVDFAKLAQAKVRKTPTGDVYLSSPWLQGSIAASGVVSRRVGAWLADAR
jgi:FMN phosphatase YigB (HAD superfamily)